MAIYRQTGPDGHYHEFSVPDGTPFEQVHALAAATLQARATLVRGPAVDPRRTPLPPRPALANGMVPLPPSSRVPLPPSGMVPLPATRRAPLPQKTSVERLPGAILGPGPSDYLVGLGPRREPPRFLNELTLEERRALPFNQPLLDDYTRDAAARYGIDPNLLIALRTGGEQSSSRSRSPKGARGVTQLMPNIARGYGAIDPTDPTQAIDAEAKFVGTELSRKYGNDIPAIVAHYNGGNAGGRAILVNEPPPSDQTRNYLPHVLKEMQRLWAAGPVARRTPLTCDVVTPQGLPYRLLGRSAPELGGVG